MARQGFCEALYVWEFVLDICRGCLKSGWLRLYHPFSCVCICVEKYFCVRVVSVELESRCCRFRCKLHLSSFLWATEFGLSYYEYSNHMP
jgi:hypothetical protein